MSLPINADLILRHLTSEKDAWTLREVAGQPTVESWGAKTVQPSDATISTHALDPTFLAWESAEISGENADNSRIDDAFNQSWAEALADLMNSGRSDITAAEITALIKTKRVAKP